MLLVIKYVAERLAHRKAHAISKFIPDNSWHECSIFLPTVHRTQIKYKYVYTLSVCLHAFKQAWVNLESHYDIA